MDSRKASKSVAYGIHRRQVLVAAVLLPLVLIGSMIGNIRLQGWTAGSAFSLTAVLGIYLSLIAFLASPIKYWWAFRVALGIIVGVCAAWILRQLSDFLTEQPAAPPFVWVLVIVMGALSLRGILRPPPDPTVEQQFVPDRDCSQPIARWISVLVYALLLIPLLFFLWGLYVMFS